MNDKEIVSQFFEQYPHWKRDANIGVLLEQTTRPVTVESLAAAANQLESVLLLHPDYEEAWLQFLDYNPEKDGLAFRREFFEGLREKELKREYESLVTELGENLRGLPLQDLREITATRKENARRKSLSSAELSTLAREERPTLAATDLPWTYQPFGKTESVELTAEVLRNVGGRNSPLSIRDLKFLVERYGSDKVNARMNASAKPQYKPLPADVTREQVLAAMRNKELAPIWSREYGSTNLNNRIFGIS